MDNKLKLIWENNPDTPIKSENLSKIAGDYSEDRMVYLDNDDFTGPGFGDNNLKLNASSIMKLSYPVTSALFDFNNTLISHDSKTIPVSSSSVTFRIESPNSNKRTLAIESETINLVLNSSFENGLNDWVEEYEGTGTNSTITIEPEGLDSNNAVLLSSDVNANKVSIHQDISLLNNQDTYSISFYIKSTDICGFLLIGNPNGSQEYWNDASKNWGGPSPYLIQPNSEYTRIELREITTDQLSPISTEMRLQFYSIGALNQIYIDNIQLEKKSYPTSHTSSTRGNGSIILPSSVLDIDQGTIELEIMPNDLSVDRTIFSVRTISPSIDAMQLYFDSVNYRLVFVIRDTLSDTNKSVFIQLDHSEFNSLVGNWKKIAIIWNKDVGIKIHMNGFSSSNLLVAYEPIPKIDITELQLGRRDNTQYLEGIFNIFKINLFEREDTLISESFLSGITPDQQIEKLFKNSGHSIILDESLLDIGNSFGLNEKYFLYIVTDSISDEECEIVISKNSECPIGANKYLTRQFGGFETDGIGTVIYESIWDVLSEKSFVTHTDRLIVNGRKNDDASFSVETEPYGPNKVTINIPTTITDFVYAGNTLNTFITIDPTGSIKIDEILIDGDTITGDDDIIINPTNTLDMNSGIGEIHLDNFRIKTNNLYINSNQDFVIENRSVKNINIISGSNININPVDHTYINSSATMSADNRFNFQESYSEKIRFNHSTENYGMGYQTSTIYTRTNDNIAFYRRGTHNNATFNSGGGQLLGAFTYGTYTPPPNIDYDSHFWSGRVHNAVYNDLAECWIRNENISCAYGMVAVQAKDGARISNKRAEKGTLGVISNTYGFILGDKDFNEDLTKSKKIPIGISGRVKVFCEKEYEIGDELVSSKNGLAIKASIFEKVFKRDRIIGRIDSIIERIGDNTLAWIKIQ